jgi:hypothetical protein
MFHCKRDVIISSPSDMCQTTTVLKLDSKEGKQYYNASYINYYGYKDAGRHNEPLRIQHTRLK